VIELKAAIEEMGYGTNRQRILQKVRSEQPVAGCQVREHDDADNVLIVFKRGGSIRTKQRIQINAVAADAGAGRNDEIFRRISAGVQAERREVECNVARQDEILQLIPAMNENIRARIIEEVGGHAGIRRGMSEKLTFIQ